ncbi:hypothetical protein MIC97_08825 [Aquamicrobium sp. NLF2-7]|uniref:hypothetical protein n=1 Tax=Aquamicrobium sp. NLF2-7 TaxID=2918753 RepID=UPI001EFA5DF4|nr:hypothetical protein [Aquamicrobium sp. NLF2-7]MCG8271604.1 hypothetical protein [Aquamicrobium sp. NLF2-7]
MSHLKNLKLANAKPLATHSDPIQRARDTVVDALAAQKTMVEAKLAGQHYAPTHKVWRKNEAGQRVLVEAPKRVRQGWFQDAYRKIFFGLRYAGKAIEFAKDKNAIEVGQLDALPDVIDTLIEAVRAGELDTQLAAAAAERSKQLRKAG